MDCITYNPWKSNSEHAIKIKLLHKILEQYKINCLSKYLIAEVVLQLLLSSDMNQKICADSDPKMQILGSLAQ